MNEPKPELPKLIINAKLFCPHCGVRHLDEERNGEKWNRRAHTTHRCQACGGDFDVYVSGADDASVRLLSATPMTREKAKSIAIRNARHAWHTKRFPKGAVVDLLAEIVDGSASPDYEPPAWIVDAILEAVNK